MQNPILIAYNYWYYGYLIHNHNVTCIIISSSSFPNRAHPSPTHLCLTCVQPHPLLWDINKSSRSRDQGQQFYDSSGDSCWIDYSGISLFLSRMFIGGSNNLCARAHQSGHTLNQWQCADLTVMVVDINKTLPTVSL